MTTHKIITKSTNIKLVALSALLAILLALACVALIQPTPTAFACGNSAPNDAPYISTPTTTQLGDSSAFVAPAAAVGASDAHTPTTTSTQLLSGDSVSSVINQPMIRGTMTTRQEGNRLITDLEYIRHNGAVHVIHYSVRLFVGQLQDFEIIGTLNRQGFDLDLESKIRGMFWFPTPASIYRSYTVDWTTGPLWQHAFNQVFTVAVVGYNTWGGSNTSYTVSVHHFTYIVPLPLPQDPPPPRGHAFAGWYLDPLFTQPFDNRPIFEDTRLYAKFIPIVYNITFALNGGNPLISPPTTFTVNDTIDLPIPTRLGHHFRGWYANPLFSGSSSDAIPLDTIGNQRFYARWEIMQFDVVFVVDGEDWNTITVDWGTVLTSFYLVDMASFRAINLYWDSSMSSLFDQAIDRDVTLYAPAPFMVFVTLTFNVMGTTTNRLMYFNDLIGDLHLPTVYGYDFVGWYTDDSFSSSVLPSTRLVGHTTIYARFVPASPNDDYDSPNAIFVWLRSYWWAVALISVGVISLAILGKKKARR